DLLEQHPSTVDHDDLTGHVIALDEEADCAVHVFGRAEAHEHGAFALPAEVFRRGVVGREHGARGDGVHADVGTERPGEDAGEVDEAGLGHAVVRVVGPGLEGGEVGDVDDHAASVSAEERYGGPGQEERPLQVDAQDPVPGGFIDGEQRCGFEGGCAVHQDVESAEGIGDPADQGVDVGREGDVRPDGDGAATEGDDVGHGALGLLRGAEVVDDDVDRKSVV